MKPFSPASPRLAATYRMPAEWAPHLATYLGHAKVSDTYWYLTGIPELLDLAAGRFERFITLDLGDLP